MVKIRYLTKDELKRAIICECGAIFASNEEDIIQEYVGKYCEPDEGSYFGVKCYVKKRKFCFCPRCKRKVYFQPVIEDVTEDVYHGTN